MNITVNKVAAFVVLLACLFGSGSSSPIQGQEQPPGTSTGQKIGTILKAAIDTALPGVTSLVSAIWGNRGTNDKMKKEELEKAVKEARLKFYAQAQEKVAPIGELANEIRVVNRAFESAVKANEGVIRMESILDSDFNPQTQWPKVEEEWQVTKAQLDSLKGLKDSDIERIRELTLQQKLKELRDVHTNVVIRVQSRIQAKDVNGLQTQLGILSQTLTGISGIVGLELAGLAREAEEAEAWAKGAAGPAISGLDEYAAFLQIVNGAIEAGKRH